MAPLFYLGIRGLTKNKVGLTKKDLIHFLPAILHVLELLPIYLKSSAEKIELLQHIFKYENELIVSVHGLVPNIWIDLIRFTLMIYYFAKSWRMIFRSDLVNKYLKSDRISSWFKASLIYFAIFQIIIPFQYFFNLQFYFTGVSFPMIRSLSTVILFLTVLIYVFEVLKNAKLSLAFNEFKENRIENLGKKKDGLVRKSILDSSDQLFKVLAKSSTDIDELKTQLNYLFEKKLIFKEKDLTVPLLANRLKVPAKYLPEILHLVYGKNFKDLVNTYRIYLCKEKIENGYLEFFTIDSLAEDVGFNSRITLYNTFKKEFKIGPTAFRKLPV